MTQKNTKKIPIDALTETFAKDFTAGGYSSQNGWQPGEPTPYASSLATVAVPVHFDYLLENYPPFQGKKEAAHEQRQHITAALWKELSADIACRISKTLIHDLDEEHITAVFKNIFNSLVFENRAFDSGRQNRTIFLVQNYNPEQQTCEGIGFINIEFRLASMNYSSKTGEYADTTLYITIRTSLYTDIDELIAEEKLIKDHFSK